MPSNWMASLMRRSAWLVLALVIALMAVPAVASAVAVASVSGTVVDAETGAPVPNVEVILFNWDTEDDYLVTTNGAGTFSLEVPPGDYDIMAFAEGYDDYFSDEPRTLVAGPNTVNFELTPMAPTVSGTVTDPKGGPVQDADVLAYTYDPRAREWLDWDWAQTGANGTWGMDISSGVYRFGFSAEGFRSEYYLDAPTIQQGRNVTLWPNRPVTGINAQLAYPTPSVTGTITSAASGLPIEGAEVWAFAPDPNAGEDEEFPYLWAGMDVTDATGAYMLGDLPNGEYLLLAEAGGFRYELFENVVEFDLATLVPFTGTVVDVDFELEPAQLSLSGVVRSAATNELVGDARVTAFALDEGQWIPHTDVWTDPETGEYAFYDLAEGTYRIGFVDGGPQIVGDTEVYFSPAYWDGAPTIEAADDIVVDGTQGTTGYDLFLPAGVQSVTGRVTSTEGGPLADIIVDAYQFDQDFEEWYSVWGGITAEDGAYEIWGLGDGLYRIGTMGGQDATGTVYSAGFWNNATTLDEADDVTTATGVTQTDIDLTLAEAQPLVRGTVRDESNQAAEGAWVSVLQRVDTEDGSFWEEVAGAMVDELGNYEAYAMSGVDYGRPVRLMVDAGPSYLPEYYNNRRDIEVADDILISPAGPVELQPIVLDPYTPAATRLSSDTRYTTAVTMAKRLTNDWEGVTHVILASGEDRAAADPLAASGLSWAYDGAPILITPSGSTPAAVINAIDEIVELNGELSIHVVGGTKSVPNARVNDILKALGGDADSVTVDRIAGASRYDNARLIARKMAQVRPDMPDFALVANGADVTKFFDALALSSVSAKTGAPILLVSATTVPSETKAVLKELPISPGNIFVAGGTRTVSPTVVKQLGTTEANRIAGASRYDTAVQVSQWAIENGWLTPNVVGVAAKLPDALTGGALIGTRGGSLLVTDSRTLSDATGEYLFELAPSLMEMQPTEVYILGGTNSVTRAVVNEINMILTMGGGEF